MELAWSPRMLRALKRAPGLGSVVRIAVELGQTSKSSGRLLIVGTPTYEPWHLVAHWQVLGDWSVSRPTLVRHSAPPNAPTHLRAGLNALTKVARADAVLVIAPDSLGSELLERLSDARHRGTKILVLAEERHGSAPERLDSIAHDAATIHSAQFDLAQHLLPAAALTF